MNGGQHTFSRDIVRHIGRLEKLRRQYMDDRLKQYGLKGAMFMMLLFLDRHPQSSQDDMGVFIGIDKSGIARKCSILEELGYIQRKQSAENKRQYELTLTKRGLGIVPFIREALTDWSSSITNGMEQDEQMQLIGFLEMMVGNATEKCG